jgi:winged helix DNA-binding protein
VSVEGWSAAIRRDDLRTLKRAEAAQPPVRLLPYFDVFLLGHKTRQHLVATQYHKRVYRTAGWIAPVILVDGRVFGVWAPARDGQRLRVRVTKFAPLPRRVAAAIREEVHHLGRFLAAADADVRFA